MSDETSPTDLAPKPRRVMKTRKSGAERQTHPNNMPEPWRTLAMAVGGVQEMANLLQVTPTTIWRWAHKQRAPRGEDRHNVIILAAEFDIPSPI
jgi:hypothetical protein